MDRKPGVKAGEGIGTAGKLPLEKGGTLKSRNQKQLELLQVIYQDACSQCVADVFDIRDLKTFETRVENEGLSFLTITLPTMSKDLDRSLAQGYIDSTAFREFRKVGTIPALMRGMFSRIFDMKTGSILNEDSPDHRNIPDIVAALRQICRTFVKLELDCTPKRVQAAMSGFVQTEHDLAEFSLDDETNTRFNLASRYLWDICLSGFNPDELIPRHGPGTTADGKSGNRKYRWERWHERVEAYFPFLGYGYSVTAALEEEFDKVTFYPEGQELPVKVTPVPKTQKGPRIIAIEPAVNQYAQGSLQRWLYARIERAAMSAGHVNFVDQSINQRLAMKSSITGLEATIDLSDASDRVPLSLAKDMFLSALGADPVLWDYIDACRSRYAKLPNGRLVGPLRKFASMGSALCFPVEAMYFYTTCVEASLWAQSLPVTRENVKNASRDVYVYGDDIIIPRTNATAILKRLAEKYNCKVNLNKSFWNGKFRESCGVDAYDGREVTPVYVRKLHPEDRRQHGSLISLCETRNSFYKKGYWQTARYLDEVLERLLGKLPLVKDDSPMLGRFTFLDIRPIVRLPVTTRKDVRWNERYQRFEVKGWVPKPAYRTDELSGFAALQKSLLRLQSKDTETFVPEASDEFHLERTARYGVATLKRRWAPI